MRTQTKEELKEIKDITFKKLQRKSEPKLRLK